MAKKKRTTNGKNADIIKFLNLGSIIENVQNIIDSSGELKIIPVDISYSPSLRVQNNIRVLNSHDFEYLRTPFDPKQIGIFLNNNHTHGLMGIINPCSNPLPILLKLLDMQYDTQTELELSTNPVAEIRLSYLQSLPNITGISGTPNLVNMLSQSITKTGFYDIKENNDLSVSTTLVLEDIPQIGQRFNIYTYNPKLKKDLIKRIKEGNDKEKLKELTKTYDLAS